MLIDEPSLGLAPNIVLQVLETLKQLTESGVSILLVEQNVNTTLQVADRAYVLEDGRVVLSGKSDELRPVTIFRKLIWASSFMKGYLFYEILQHQRY